MCTCNSSSCNGACGSLIVNKGTSGNPGVGIRSITSSVDSVGNTIIKITLTSGVVNNVTLPIGLQGLSVHHSSITTSTISSLTPPTASLPGAVDTYTLWADEAETIAIGTYKIYNGADGLSDSVFSNVGGEAEVFQVGSAYNFRTFKSDNLTVTQTTDQIKINDPRYPVEVVLTSSSGTYDLLMDSYQYYQPIEITNKTLSPVTIVIPAGYSFEECPYLISPLQLVLLPTGTLRVWKSLKETVNKVSILSYKCKAYSREVTDFQNNFKYDTDRIYVRATESRQITIAGRLRFAGSNINDNGIVFKIETPFTPPRVVYFEGTAFINGGSPSVLTSLGQQTAFPVSFSVSPAGIVTLIGAAARIGSVDPSPLSAGSDVRFVKTYIDTIRFTGIWDGANAINTVPISDS